MVKSFLTDLGLKVSLLILLHIDNLSTISLASNPVLHARTKHIDVDRYFVRDKAQEGFILPKFVPSSQQLTDVFTKAFGRQPHRANISKFVGE